MEVITESPDFHNKKSTNMRKQTNKTRKIKQETCEHKHEQQREKKTNTKKTTKKKKRNTKPRDSTWCFSELGKKRAKFLEVN